MAVEHDYFGIIDSDSEGGLYWSDNAEVGDQVVDVSLSVPGGQAVSDDALDTAAAMIAALEDLDLRAREAMLSQLDSRGSDVARFVEESADELGDDLDDLLVDRSGDLEVDVIRSLRLIRAALHPHQSGEGQVFLSLEFALDPDTSDSALLTQLTVRGETVGIEIIG